MAKLTVKQQRFCDEYLIDLNATQAAIRAGYSEKTARQTAAENLSKPYIREYIDKRLAEKEAELIADQDEVLQTLTRVLRRQEMDTVVVTCKERSSGYDKNGKKVIIEKEVPQLVQVPTKVSDLNKAAELLGKRYALFTDKVDMDTDLDLNITIDYGEDENEKK
jgi:phage terminase small subunit